MSETLSLTASQWELLFFYPGGRHLAAQRSTQGDRPCCLWWRVQPELQVKTNPTCRKRLINFLSDAATRVKNVSKKICLQLQFIDISFSNSNFQLGNAYFWQNNWPKLKKGTYFPVWIFCAIKFFKHCSASGISVVDSMICAGLPEGGM